MKGRVKTADNTEKPCLGCGGSPPPTANKETGRPRVEVGDYVFKRGNLEATLLTCPLGAWVGPLLPGLCELLK